MGCLIVLLVFDIVIWLFKYNKNSLIYILFCDVYVVLNNDFGVSYFIGIWVYKMKN